MVNDLSKLATGKRMTDNNVAESEMLQQTLHCLVTIMKSLVDWSKDLRTEKNPEERELEQKGLMQ